MAQDFSNKTLLLTRPMEDCFRFANCLHSVNAKIKLIYGPLFEIKHFPIIEPPSRGKKLIFTSKNAIASLSNSEIFYKGDAFCVGSETALKAREVGMNSVNADGNVIDLIKLIKRFSSPEKDSFVYYRGKEVSCDLALKLRNLKYSVEEVICYTKNQISYDSILKRDLSGGVIRGAVFFSKNTALLFSKNVISLPQGFNCFCISKGVSDTLKKFYHADQLIIMTAKKPTANSMVNLINQEFLN